MSGEARTWAERAAEEFDGGNWERALSAAQVSQAFSALPREPKAKRSEPEECAYANSHPYMSEPCTLCGYERT